MIRKIAVAALAAWPLFAAAQGFPAKPVTIIVPFSPGGPSDTNVRQFATAYGRQLGQPVLVENVAGGSGNIGPARVAKSGPDGYTLSQVPFGVFRVPHMQKTSYDTLKDFTWIICMTGYTFGLVVKADSPIKSIKDLKGKTIVSTAGTTNIKAATDLNVSKNMGMNIIPANGHPEAFQMVETGRAVAFVMDDILLYTLVAYSRTPGDYVISADATGLPEPYGIMLRKDDPAFKKVVDNAMIAIYKSGEINKIYDKWFTQAVPPKGINYNVPMSPQFKNVIAHPTDSPDPAVYK